MKFAAGQKTYVIAEIGANHNGDMALAKKLIDVAKDCGADAAKFQSWDTTIFSKTVYEKNYFLGDDYRNRSDFTLKEIVEEFALGFEQMRELREYCAKVGIDFATTPFSVTQLDQLVALDPPFIKIASMDLTNPRLLKAAGRTRLPIVLSTGFGTLEEIDRAVRLIEGEGNRDIVILHCIALYPPHDDEVNLDNMDMLRAAFGYPVGFSDHTAGTEISLAAAAKRAVVLEKHFTLDKTMFGWDHHMSVDPDELRTICRARDRIHAALGTTRRVVGEREMKRRDEYRRSIVAARDIQAGETITEDAIDFRRPGTGLEPVMADTIVGMVAVRDIQDDTLISLDDLTTAGAVPRASAGRN
jgi:N-acetylneuraminate synthase